MLISNPEAGLKLKVEQPMHSCSEVSVVDCFDTDYLEKIFYPKF